MKNLLLISASKGYAFSLGSLILNISKASPGVFDHALVLSDDLTLRDKEIISEKIPSDFASYQTPLSKAARRRSPYLRFFTPHVLAKLEAFRNLNGYQSVTWLDNDVLVVGPLDTLVAQTPHGASFVSTHLSLGEQFLRKIEGYNLALQAPAGGTFSIYENFPEPQSFYTTAMDLAEKFSRDLFLPDQAVLGVAFQTIGLSWTPLDEEVYAPHPDSATEQAVIHHPFGPRKFWSGQYSEQWNSNYSEWVALGGSRISAQAKLREFFRTPVKLEIRARKWIDSLCQRFWSR